jgi:hypothetical protein
MCFTFIFIHYYLFLYSGLKEECCGTLRSADALARSVGKMGVDRQTGLPSAAFIWGGACQAASGPVVAIYSAIISALANRSGHSGWVPFAFAFARLGSSFEGFAVPSIPFLSQGFRNCFKQKGNKRVRTVVIFVHTSIF